MNISLSPFAPENLVSRDGLGSTVHATEAKICHRYSKPCGTYSTIITCSRLGMNLTSPIVLIVLIVGGHNAVAIKKVRPSLPTRSDYFVFWPIIFLQQKTLQGITSVDACCSSAFVTPHRNVMSRGNAPPPPPPSTPRARGDKISPFSFLLITECLGAQNISEDGDDNRVLHTTTLFRELNIICETVETSVRTRRLLWPRLFLLMGDHRLPKRIISGMLENVGPGGEEEVCVADDSGVWDREGVDNHHSRSKTNGSENEGGGRQRGGGAYGQPKASAARPHARASTSCREGDQIPGAGREEQEHEVDWKGHGARKRAKGLKRREAKREGVRLQEQKARKQ